LREKVATYSPLFDIRIHNERRYELWLEKNLLIDGRKRKEVVFASLIIQKDIVGFYFRPVDAKPELTKAFSPELAKLLKGSLVFISRSWLVLYWRKLKKLWKLALRYTWREGVCKWLFQNLKTYWMSKLGKSLPV
jgi:hypothetical protein